MEIPEEHQSFDYGFLTRDTTLSMEGLLVQDVAFTTSSDINGMLLDCEKDGIRLQLRITSLPLEAELGEALKGKSLNIKGLVSASQGLYQIKILSLNDMEIVDP